MVSTVSAERTSLHMETHQTGASDINTEWDRAPMHLPIAVYYDYETNIIEVWNSDISIQAEIYIYNENGDLVAYSPYMNVSIPIFSRKM